MSIFESIGRAKDPATAPNIPVYIQITRRGKMAEVLLSGWNRDEDHVMDFKFRVRTEKCELRYRPVTQEEVDWLAAIGAREST